MEEKQWLDYDGQSTQELLELAKTHAEESVVVAFDEALQVKEKDELSEEEKVVLAVAAMDREVNHGGFDQFFVSESAQYAPLLAESLTRIGCPKTAELVERAIRALGLRQPFSGEDVETALQLESPRRDKELDACDQGYAEKEEPVFAALLEFVRANAEKISLPPAAD